MRLILLLESVQEEYWITPNQVLHATGEGEGYNHEEHVVDTILIQFIQSVRSSPIGDAFDHDWLQEYGCDYTMFREELLSAMDRAGMDDVDFDDFIMSGIKGVPTNEMKAMFDVVEGRLDGREFAITYWGWIRVAGNNVEAPNLLPVTLKKIGKALCDILFDEGDDPDHDITFSVSTYTGQRQDVSLNNLLDGRMEGIDSNSEDLRQAGKRAVNALDQAAVHPFYQSANA